MSGAELKHIRYPDIGQFRNVVQGVNYHYDEPPVLDFFGRVKVHGTNASVVILPDGVQYVQSRNNIITPDNDNCGFAAWHTTSRDWFELYAKICRKHDDQAVVVYGEWAGQGIQSGVAVNQVDKFFYVYDVRLLGQDGSDVWLKNYLVAEAPVHRIYDARAARRAFIKIDFSQPAMAQNGLIEVTEEVEKECPVGRMLGVSGVGEGMVWKHYTDDGRLLAFKVKGEKHSVSKVKKLAPVDVEKLASIEEFVEYAVTDNRLAQGLQEACGGDADRKLLGKFLKWVNTDIHKEEQDTLDKNGLSMKDVNKAVSHRAKQYFFEREEI